MVVILAKAETHVIHGQNVLMQHTITEILILPIVFPTIFCSARIMHSCYRLVLTAHLSADCFDTIWLRPSATCLVEWLAPLPDKSLPNLKIREALLRQLIDFPPINTELLKMSGVGKAVMYLYKHPKEIRVNKEMCGKLVNDWSRPIFNLTSNYKMLSREEREQRDYEHLPKKRRLGLEGGDTPRRDIERALQDKAGAPKPGDPDWVMRARVPQPSKKDYVVRPKWVVEEIPRGAGKKTLTRYERKMREMAEKKKHNKAQRAVTISIEGRNMGM